MAPEMAIAKIFKFSRLCMFWQCLIGAANLPRGEDFNKLIFFSFAPQTDFLWGITFITILISTKFDPFPPFLFLSLCSFFLPWSLISDYFITVTWQKIRVPYVMCGHDIKAAMLEEWWYPLGFSVQERILFNHILIYNHCSEWESLVQT